MSFGRSFSRILTHLLLTKLFLTEISLDKTKFTKKHQVLLQVQFETF